MFVYWKLDFRHIRTSGTKESDQDNSNQASELLKNDTSSKEKEYFELLQKLVETKMRAEAEAKEAMDFKDLRVDLKNIIEVELKKPNEKVIAECDTCKGKVWMTNWKWNWS